jgi:hypothetical protein
MNRWLRSASLWVVSTAALHAASYTVGYQKTLPIPLAGATAAYSVNSEVAEASADQGIVTVLGKSPGSTHVVVIAPSGVQTLDIVVPMPPPIYPRGWVTPRPEGVSNEFGYYETRYSSLPQQLTNILDFSRQGADMTTHFHVAATDFFPSSSNLYGNLGVSSFALTSLSYSIQTSERSVTLVDQFVDESPLTVGGAIVRGLHWQEGNWIFHGGYTSPAAFEGIFLPIRPEGAFGIGYRYKLTIHSSLTPSVYYLTMPSTNHAGNPGTIASLLYSYNPSDTFHLAAEIGHSRGVGGSFNLSRRRPGENLRVRFRYTPEHFAALSISNFRGLYSDLTWDRQWSERFGSDLTFTGDRFNLPGFQELTVNGGLQLRYKLDRHWSAFGGATYSYFRMEVPGQSPLEGMYYPVGAGFNSHYFGATFQHQWSRYTGQDTGGHQWLASMHTGFGPLSFSGYAQRQTQAPALGFLLTNVTGLAQLLNQYGVTATTPQQIGDFLNQYASLINLQYLRNVTVNLTPVREQVSGSATLQGRGAHPQLDYEFLYDADQSVSSTTQVVIHRATATQRLGLSNDLSVTLALYKTRTTGQPPVSNPLVALSLRHHFNTAPAFLVLEHHGTIRGRVFEDADGQGQYVGSAPGVAGIEITLDDRRRTRTVSDGSYRFPGVPEGKHQVQAVLRDNTPYYFTTPERSETSEDAELFFGIARSLSSLGGEIRDDVNRGIAGVVVAIQGDKSRLSAISGGDGKFLVPRLPDGPYSVSVDPDSLPAGYLIDSPASVQVTTKSGGASRANLRIRALRNISGRVVLYDRKLGQYVGIPDVAVTLNELSLRNKTASDGRFLFRELPSGTFTVSAEYEGQTINKIVKIPEDPAQIANINLIIGQR